MQVSVTCVRLVASRVLRLKLLPFIFNVDLSNNITSILHSWKEMSYSGMLAVNTCIKYAYLSVHLPPCKNSQPDEWIFTKFYMWDFFCLCLPPIFIIISCSDYSSTIKMDNIRSSETSVDFHRTTRRYIPSTIIDISYRI
jgi:hypothetical protein